MTGKNITSNSLVIHAYITKDSNRQTHFWLYKSTEAEEARLVYFKCKVLEALAASERRDVQKAIAFMEKARAVYHDNDTHRRVDGHIYRRIRPGVWVRVYDMGRKVGNFLRQMWHSRVAACHDAMQLMHLVQKYRHRFCDEDGKPYGWVCCLREAADERREKILAVAAIGREVVDSNRGGILNKSSEEQDRFAAEYYAQIRNRKSKSDIKAIAKNTGFSQEKIAAVRSHVFFDSHLFDNGSIRKFDPDVNMALAWQRLEQGWQTDTDVMLLNHEYTELAFMQKKGYSYRKAHWLANVRYPWQFEIEKEKLPHDKVREIIRDSLKSII